MLALFAPSVFSSAPGSLQPPDHWMPHPASTGDGGGESNQRVQHANIHNTASSPTVPQTELGLPQLVVIGFQKAGTTFLRYLLASHPEIRTKCTKMAEGCISASDCNGRAGCQICKVAEGPQEAHFFDWNFLGDTAESTNIEEVRRAYAKWLGQRATGQMDETTALGCPATGAERVVFDETPSYSRMETDRIRLINATVPSNTKFIAIVRDPLELKKSYRKMVACFSGSPNENNCTLSKVESDPLADDRHWSNDYTGHLREWRGIVGTPRLRVVLFDDLVDQTLSTYNGLLDFIGLPAVETLPEVPTQPLAETDCWHAECGEDLNGAILAKFEDPVLCTSLAAEARTDLEGLREELGIDTPASWATCPSSMTPDMRISAATSRTANGTFGTVFKAT